MTGDTLMSLAVTLGTPIALAIGWMAVDAMKTKGYRTAYAEALLRAVGTAANAAALRGTTLYTDEGRRIGLAAGVSYMESTVGDSATKLGIVTPEDHAMRIDAQIGVPLAVSVASKVAPSLIASATGAVSEVTAKPFAAVTTLGDALPPTPVPR